MQQVPAQVRRSRLSSSLTPPRRRKPGTVLRWGILPRPRLGEVAPARAPAAPSSRTGPYPCT
eukprot:15075120-Alexandrium_andersonii.AAC.1